jgi:transcriptional regulator with XRE-family HTH domain
MGEMALTQEALADKAGVDPTTVNAFLKGRNWPQARTRAKLEVALGWPVGMLARIALGEEPPRSMPATADELRRLIAEAQEELTWLTPRYESTRRLITARLNREIADLQRRLQALEGETPSETDS